MGRRIKPVRRDGDYFAKESEIAEVSQMVRSVS
jgi:hypothetical protein